MIVAAIPAYNEEVAIGSMIARAKVHVDEVLVIDDGSHDATGSVEKHFLSVEYTENIFVVKEVFLCQQ